MGSFSDDDVILLVLNLVCQLREPFYRRFQRVQVWVVNIDVDDSVDVERNVFCSNAQALVGKTVLIFATGLGHSQDVTVGDLVFPLHNQPQRVQDPEIACQLLGGLWVTVSNLERHRKLVVGLEVFEETLLAVRREKHIVRHGEPNKEEREEEHGALFRI